MTREPASNRVPASNRLVSREMKASLRFDGTNDAVNYGAEESLRITGDVTLQAWVNHASLSGTQVYAMCNISGETEETNILYYLGITSNGRIRWLHEYDAGLNEQILSTAPLPSISRWYNLVATRDTTEKEIRFYKDGTLLETLSYTNDTTGGSTTTLSIGETTDGFDDLNGLIAEARIWNRALSADEVSALHFNNDVPATGLVLDPDFGQGAGDTLFDRSSSGFEGTITGATFSSVTPIKARQPVNRNLVYNGDFEFAPPVNVPQTGNFTWTDGTASGSSTNRLFGYAKFSWSGSNYMMYDDSEAHSGGYSFRLSTTDVNSNIGASIIRQASDFNFMRHTPYVFQLLPNTSYISTCWIKTNVTSGSANGALAAVRQLDGNSNATADTAISPSINETTDWTKYDTEFTTNANTRFGVIRLSNSGDSGDGDLIMDAWFDDIEIKPTTPVTRENL